MKDPHEVLTLELAANGTRTYRDPDGNQLVLPALGVQQGNLREGRNYQMPEARITLANGQQMNVGYLRAEAAMSRQEQHSLGSVRDALGQGGTRMLGMLGVGDGSSTRDVVMPVDAIERLARSEAARTR